MSPIEDRLSAREWPRRVLLSEATDESQVQILSARREVMSAWGLPWRPKSAALGFSTATEVR